MFAGFAPLYFGAAAKILTIISLGHWLEARATRKAGAAIEGLVQSLTALSWGQWSRQQSEADRVCVHCIHWRKRCKSDPVIRNDEGRNCPAHFAALCFLTPPVHDFCP
jgi:hypothetical protein